ncbi:2'-5' RNA ligase family protein [Streptomyces subrutilus]|uniref:2'-5' RNA ligase family protein n=1 Tax=Streptomyces subrutilus TaxID=36818 RepID=UPI0039907D29|nr:2'-5' RNA ligase family protein [Streptomyces subrutilus]
MRARLDPRDGRVPAHVNLLFGFVPESAFEEALPLLAEVAAGTAPFTARLAGVRVFGHREDAGVRLAPAGAGAAWDWRDPVALAPLPGRAGAVPYGTGTRTDTGGTDIGAGPVTVLTPSAPWRRRTGTSPVCRAPRLLPRRSGGSAGPAAPRLVGRWTEQPTSNERT